MEGLTRLVLRHRWLVLGAWIVVFGLCGLASTQLSGLLTNRFTLPGTDTRRAERILEDHFRQRSTGTFTVVARTDGPATALVPQVRAAAERAAAELPTGRLVSVAAVSDDVVVAQIVSNLEPADSKGRTDEMREAVAGARGGGGLRHRPGGDRARPRPGVGRRPHQRRVGRCSDRPSHPHLHLRDAGLPPPVRIHDRDDPDDARDRLGLRQLHGADDVPHEPGHADRARDRDRLLAARRLPLPRGAAARVVAGRGDRDDDGDGGPRRRLQRDGRRDRACAAALHAAPVHPRVRDRRPDHSRGLRGRGRDVSPGAPVAGRAAARPRAAPAGELARPPSGSRARVLGPPRALHHALPQARRGARRPHS